MTKGNFFTKKASSMLFAFVAACFTFLFMVDPLSADDLWFLTDLRTFGGIDENGSITNFDVAIPEMLKEHYLHDVSQLGNFLGMLSLCLPAWIPSAFISACFIATLLLMTKLAGLHSENFIGLSVLVFMLVFGVIWEDDMFSIMFGFNYTCSTLVMLIALKLFLYEDSQRLARLMFISVFGILAGAWHESFTAAVVAGCTAMLILNRSMIRRDRVVLLVSMAIGSAFIFLSPSFVNRIDNLYDDKALIVRFVYTCPWFILAVLSLICISRKKWRKLPSDPIVTIAIISGFLIIFLFFTSRIRAIFPTLILSGIGTVSLMGKMWPQFFNHDKTIALLFGVTISLITVIHLSVVCQRAWKFRTALVETQQQLDLDSHQECSRTVFVPIYSHSGESALSLNRPSKKFAFTYHHLCSWYGGHINLIPIELKHYRAGMGTKLKSNADAELYNGYVILKNHFKHRYFDWISYGSKTDIMDAWGCYFIGEDDYIYCCPLISRNVISSYLGDPTEVYINGD